MNWEDKDIDDLFREAADSAQFEYNDAYFEAIDAQLPLRKRRALWIWFSVLIVALTAGGLWIFTETTLPIDEKQISKTDKENLTESQVSAKETSAANEQTENDREADSGFGDAERMEQPQVKQEGIMKSVIISQSNQEEIFVLTDEEIRLEDNRFENNRFEENSIVSEEVTVINDDPISSSVNEAEITQVELGEEVIINASHDLAILSPGLKPRNSIFIEAAAGLGQSYIRSVENGANRMANYSLLVGYSCQRGTWSYRAGAGLNHKTFNNLNIADRSEIYGFGLTTYENSYSFSSLTSAQLNFGVNYQIRKHQIGLGLNLQIPVSPRITFSEYQNGELAASGSAFVDRSFFRTTIEPELNYAFSLNKRFDLGMKIHAPILNPINSDRITGERAALPINGQVLLKWNLGLK
jgi:hypothetical protein